MEKTVFIKTLVKATPFYLVIVIYGLQKCGNHNLKSYLVDLDVSFLTSGITGNLVIYTHQLLPVEILADHA
ncbi:hypothetical protein COB11_06605 [Candidatus Aerophobetes bacterium]|uniref:Uncharacterized protein n=1 Tax=Aerophobetes bacterium TaxID=2030807 RepID=A0A2A4YD72_UNCAE|nr:MAG: hypothetical protein COB11_06605 [Candidatus Aerophobetes bacterium]